MQFFTIGYGGRQPAEFVETLMRSGVRCVVDVRLRPDKASMGSYSKAKTSDKGIEKLLGEAGISYRSLTELGNVFLGEDDWPDRYQELIARAGDLLTYRIDEAPEPFCLLCAERDHHACHRQAIADFLVRTRGWQAVHLE